MRTFVREQYSILSPLLLLRVTTAHLRSGMYFLKVSPNFVANSTRYLNGSILIATLKPAFTILHTLTTSRAPSRITGLAWHGTSSKQKSDMLATQTADGDLRVWSVPKSPQHETPTIIRALSRSDIRQPGPSWFAWSKNGRLVQYYDGSVSPICLLLHF
jgi:WD40 repeat protein